MITHIELSGFKSIEHMSLDMRPLNVLIGANGAGKSNLLSFLDFLRHLADGRLQWYVSETGFANAILFRGARHTQTIRFRVDFQDIRLGKCYYSATLRYARGDVLHFEEERYGLSLGEVDEDNRDLGRGHMESRLLEVRHPGTNELIQLLAAMRIFHFTDTTPLSGMRQHHPVSDFASLRPDGRNLAVVLYNLWKGAPQYYDRILLTVRQILPWLHDFVFQEENSTGRNAVSVGWRGEAPDDVFKAHQLPDGALRAIALVTLLLQLDDQFPAVVAIDEPELGLHPMAINVVASLVRGSVVPRDENQRFPPHQIVLATQSPTWLDHFEPEDIVVVDRIDPGLPAELRNPAGAASTFRRLSEEGYDDWLTEYSVGDLWERNVIGGGPA